MAQIDLSVDSWHYECTRGEIIKTQFERDLKTASPWFREIWMLIAGFTLWYVWKACCLKFFQDMVQPPEELMMDIWFVIINFLRGQLDEVCYHSNDVVIARLRFQQKWRNTPIVTQGGKRSEVELPAPTLVVSYSLATLSSLQAPRVGSLSSQPTLKGTAFSYRYLLTLSSQFARLCKQSHFLELDRRMIP